MPRGSGAPDVTPTVAELRDLVPFVDCSDDQLDHVRRLASPRHLDAGATLVRRGGATDHLIVVRSGRLRVTDDADLDGEVGPGDVVGEMAALGGERRSADVTAVTATDVLVFDGPVLDELLDVEPVLRRLRAIAEARLEAAGTRVVTAASVPVIRPLPRVRGRGAGMRSRHEVPARPVRAVGLMLTALVIGAAGSWILTERNRTTAVTIEDLLARPAHETAPAGGVEPPVPASATAPVRASPSAGVVDGPVTPPGTDAPVDAEAPAPSGDVPQTAPVPDPAPAASAETPTPVEARFERPAPGIYSYATTGGERISLAGASHDYPETTHAVLDHRDGCVWRLEHHVVEEHVDVLERCTSDVGVQVLLRGSEIEFFGQRDGLVYVCDPPAGLLPPGAPGTTSTGVCRSEDGRGEAHYVGTYVGPETLTVEGSAVATEHVQVDYELRGAAEGTSNVDWWVDPRTGLTVREERVVDTRADAIWGDVRYQEEATFHLRSLTPRT